MGGHAHKGNRALWELLLAEVVEVNDLDVLNTCLLYTSDAADE